MSQPRTSGRRQPCRHASGTAAACDRTSSHGASANGVYSCFPAPSIAGSQRSERQGSDTRPSTRLDDLAPSGRYGASEHLSGVTGPNSPNEQLVTAAMHRAHDVDAFDAGPSGVVQGCGG